MGPTDPRTLLPVLAKAGSAGPAGTGLEARTPNQATWRAPASDLSPGADLGAVLLTIGLAWLTALVLVLAFLGGR